MENESKTMNTKELTHAVSLLLEREERRDAQQRRKQRRRVRRRRDEMRESIARLSHSIEVIKWCIVIITSVMATAIVILVVVVWQIGNEAERIKGEVQQIKGEATAIVKQIEHEADMIRDKIQNPMRTIGEALGKQLDKKVGSVLGIDNDE